VGQDPASDIAVIRIDAPPESLHPVAFGDSSQLRVGQNVYAIGNPFGLDRTLTTGVISSLNRTLPVSRSRSLKSIIQIDAAINPGNSGGPLLDSRARLIGMNTAIASRTGQSSGVGFAIPVNSIARVVPQLIQQGRVVRPDSGIVAVYSTREGLRIAELTRGGPAERAGLRGPQVVRKKKGPFIFETLDRTAADVIIAVDGQKATAADDFLSLVENHKPGEQAVITVLRDGRPIDVPVLLTEAE
jgi:S1-C subfamily serine protease